MARLEELTRGAQVKGILPGAVVTVMDVKWHGAVAIELTYKDAAGHPGSEPLYCNRPYGCRDILLVSYNYILCFPSNMICRAIFVQSTCC